MSRTQLLIINGAVLTVCAVFDYAWRTNLLIGLMLFLPLFDKTWSFPDISFNKSKLIIWGVIMAMGLILIALNPDYATAAVGTLVFAALPEEWFFRAYFMQQLSTGIGVKCNESPRWGYLCRFAFRRTGAAKVVPAVLNQSAYIANILSSAFFAILHTPTQGWFGLLVFFPSLIYGWLYQRTKDLLLAIFLHALSNIVFFIYMDL